MNTNVNTEDATSPEGFIASLRRAAQQCAKDASTFDGNCNDGSAEIFWSHAAKLKKLADRLEAKS